MLGKIIRRLFGLEDVPAPVASHALSVSEGISAEGDVVSGNKFTTYSITVHQGRYEGDVPTDDRRALAIYREVLATRCGSLPLTGLDLRADDAGAKFQALSLEQVYIGLDTTTLVVMRETDDVIRSMPVSTFRGPGGAMPKIDLEGKLREGEKARPLTAVEAVANNRNVVLLGDPGSGKSTFVNRLCLAFARQQWQHLDTYPEPDRARLPILLILRDFARWLSTRGATEGDAALLYEYLVHDLKRRNMGFAAALIDQALDREFGAIVFLDGLDEVPPEARPLVLGSVERFAERYTWATILVTCRVVTYENPDWKLNESFQSHRLAPFDQDKINSFVTAWYDEMGRRWQDVGGRHLELAERLREALRRPDLAEFASNPLLLTVMSLVHTQEKKLPEHRAELYNHAVEVLLWRWEEGKQSGEPALLQRLREINRDAKDLLRVLRKQAFEAHKQAGHTEQVAGIAATTLVPELAWLHRDESLVWARDFVALMGQRSGLLVEREPGVFVFPHRTFQEYLAATQLASMSKYPARVLQLADRGDYWREVILLSVGYWVHVQNDLDRPRQVIDDLCPAHSLCDDTGWRRVRLAGEALLEMGVHRLADLDFLDDDLNDLNEVITREGPPVEDRPGERLKRRVLDLLTALVEGGHLPAAERVHAGEVLGKLGDPRFDPERFYLPCRFRGEPEKQFGFVKIPAGTFFMGREGDHPGPLTMPHDFWIARYPVTVAQFGAFVDDGGYQDEQWWVTEAARQWLAEGTTCPGYWESQRLHPNRPVMGVCWFEAMAYCAWLDAKLRGEFPAGYRVMLSTEAEWEMAARGGGTAPYPWGDTEINEERANFEGNIGEPSSVGAYPAGATPTELLDLAGNVWEWTLSAYADYPYKNEVNIPSGDNSRVLRGGSWNGDGPAARCAYRDRDSPGARDLSLGFRVVVSLAFDS